MSNKEKDLSEYIDRLNAEKKPKGSAENNEMERLFDTVRQVRSIKEPVMPGKGFQNKLISNLTGDVSRKRTAKSSKSPWLISAAAIAAVVMVAFFVNILLPFGNANIAYAVEKAFQGIKAYHGTMQISETNAEGKTTTQARLEIWANKQGHYYVKGLEGSQAGLITANNGQKKWQLRPEDNKAYIFSAFPDPYKFTFELGKEVENLKDSLESKKVGEEVISGRNTTVVEVTPKGGASYKLWIDNETNLPLQKQTAMQNALQYTVTFTEIDFSDAIPEQFTTYSLPAGFEEINNNPEQIVANMAEAQGITGFTPNAPQNIPAGYSLESIAVETASKTLKLNYATQDKTKQMVILESNIANSFEPAPAAVRGQVGSSIAEVQSPTIENLGVLAGGTYAGITDISSVRWQQNSLEYAVVGNDSLDVITQFIKSLNMGEVQVTSDSIQMKPQIEVPVDMNVEEGDQKNSDSGHSPWKLDPAQVAQVFVSLKISPEGISGDYPIKYGNIKITQNTGKEAIAEISSDNSPVSKVYLKRLVRQDSTGIWTVIGYDPAR